MPANLTEVMWLPGRLLLGAYFAWAGAVSTWKTNLALLGGLLIGAASAF